VQINETASKNLYYLASSRIQTCIWPFAITINDRK